MPPPERRLTAGPEHAEQANLERMPPPARVLLCPERIGPDYQRRPSMVREWTTQGSAGLGRSLCPNARVSSCTCPAEFKPMERWLPPTCKIAASPTSVP